MTPFAKFALKKAGGDLFMVAAVLLAAAAFVAVAVAVIKIARYFL